MKNNKVFWGVLLIVLGVLFLVDQMGIFDPWHISVWTLIWKLWPLILIFLAVRLLLQQNFTGGVILLVFGTVFLTTNLFNWSFFGVLWPLLIIGIGVSVLFKKEEKSSFNTSATLSKEDYVDDTVAFWGVDKKVESDNFKGGDINVAFGGITLNLRDVKVKKEGAKLNINVAFGGADIYVPKNCRVITNGTGVFGGWSPEIKASDVSEPVLEISGVAAFGGVDIKE